MKNVNDSFSVFSHSSLVNMEEGAVRVTPPCSGFAQFTVQVNCYGSVKKTTKLANETEEIHMHPQRADLGFGEEHAVRAQCS